MPRSSSGAFALALLLIPAPAARAGETDSPWFRRHHVVFGLGTGQAFEQDIFNV
jgi:hypothetical protein